MMSPSAIKRTILGPLCNACVEVDHLNNLWQTPQTAFLPLDWNWGAMAKVPAHQIVSVQPCFFEEEADPNRNDSPRLDILIILERRNWVRYHPDAEPIHSWDALPTLPMAERMQRQREIVIQRHIRS